MKTSPAYMRSVIFARDKGICAWCSTDTQKNRAEYFERRRALNLNAHISGHSLFEKLNEEYGMPAGKVSGDWWEADHIVPVVEGGGECGAEGYRTLCVACHRSVTAGLARRLALARKQAKITKRDQARGLLDGVGAIDIGNGNVV
jgi:5-methylcytosine-specific restriction enzyme A